MAARSAAAQALLVERLERSAAERAALAERYEAARSGA
jgi:hypothetical protein